MLSLKIFSSRFDEVLKNNQAVNFEQNFRKKQLFAFFWENDTSTFPVMLAGFGFPGLDPNYYEAWSILIILNYLFILLHTQQTYEQQNNHFSFLCSQPMFFLLQSCCFLSWWFFSTIRFEQLMSTSSSYQKKTKLP